MFWNKLFCDGSAVVKVFWNKLFCDGSAVVLNRDRKLIIFWRRSTVRWRIGIFPRAFIFIIIIFLCLESKCFETDYFATGCRYRDHKVIDGWMFLMVCLRAVVGFRVEGHFCCICDVSFYIGMHYKSLVWAFTYIMFVLGFVLLIIFCVYMVGPAKR